MAGKTIKGITIELDGSTVKLGKALKNILGESKSLEKQLIQVDKALKFDPYNTELLATKQRILGDQIENTAEHLELLRKAEEKAAASVDNYDDWAAAYAPIQEQIDKTKKKLTQLSAEQKKMERIGDIDTDAYRNLSAEIEDLEAALKDLRQQGEAVNEQFGEPISTREYEQLQTEIVLTEAKLNNAREEAAKVADTLDKINSGELKDVSKAATDAEDALEGAKKEAADFGDVLKANVIADGAKAIAESMADVVEETREYQKIMGSLEMSSQYNGYSADQTREAYERLFGVLQDDQSAATTLANLQALHLEQSDLMNVVDACIGGWALYGDSIPIDSLAESINETTKAGQVTGTFADILNWAGMSEDAFNEKLSICANEHERLKLVMSALSQQELPTVGKLWRENNSVLVENNEANAHLQEQLGDLGEALMPIATMLTEMLTKALSWFNGLDDGTQRFIVTTVLLTAVLGPITGIVKNLNGGIGDIIGTGGGLSSMLTSAISGFSGLGTVMGGLKFAAVAAGILAVVDSLVWLSNHSEEAKTVIAEDMEAMGNAIVAHEIKVTDAQINSWQSFFSSVSSGWSQFWNFMASNWQTGNEALLTGTHDAHVAQVTAAQDFFSNLSSTYQAGNQLIVEGNHAAHVAQVVNWQNFSAEVSATTSSFWDSMISSYQTGNSAVTAETHAAHVAQVSAIQSLMANLKSTCSAGLNSLVSSFTSYFQNVLSKATNWGTNMKTKAVSMIDGVRNAISSGLERAKSLFNFSWSLPHIKLPHFQVSGSFSLNPPQVPDFSVAWYAKGAILNGARIFGAMGNKLLGGGEAGPEAVLPLSGFYSELRNILASFMGSPGESIDMTALYSRLDGIYDRLGRLQVVLDTGTLVGETVDQFDAAFAEKQRLAERGV